MSNVSNILLYLAVLSFVFISCSSSSSNDNEEGSGNPSDLPLENLMRQDISFMVVTIEEFEEDLDAYVMINTTENYESVSLKINGNQVQLESWFGFYFADLELTPAQQIDFELEADDNSYSGSLTIPGLVQASFPTNFDLSSSYSFSWEIDQDPPSFIAWLDIDTDDEWVEKADLLGGDARSHTFDSSIYSHLSEDDVWYIDVGVSAIDFDIRDDFVFVASIDHYHEYEFDSDFFFRKKDQPGGRLFQLIMESGR